jgi:hypothetical protein
LVFFPAEASWVLSTFLQAGHEKSIMSEVLCGPSAAGLGD